MQNHSVLKAKLLYERVCPKVTNSLTHFNVICLSYIIQHSLTLSSVILAFKSGVTFCKENGIEALFLWYLFVWLLISISVNSFAHMGKFVLVSFTILYKSFIIVMHIYKKDVVPNRWTYKNVTTSTANTENITANSKLNT